jgi:hypothetical protein
MANLPADDKVNGVFIMNRANLLYLPILINLCQIDRVSNGPISIARRSGDQEVLLRKCDCLLHELSIDLDASEKSCHPGEKHLSHGNFLNA